MRATRRERRHARAPFGAPVELWKQRTPTLVKAVDISRGGLFLSTDEIVGEGSYLTVRIALPGYRRFTAMCRVTRVQCGRGLVRGPGLGLEFIDVSPADKERIDAYVRRALERSVAALV